MSWVSTKVVWYLERVFKPQGAVTYEFNVSHFWHSTTGENIREHYGTLTKYFSLYFFRIYSFSFLRVYWLRYDHLSFIIWNQGLYIQYVFFLLKCRRCNRRYPLTHFSWSYAVPGCISACGDAEGYGNFSYEWKYLNACKNTLAQVKDH